MGKTKYCSKCETDKIVGYFAKNKSKKDGLNSYCKSCNKKYQKSHYKNNKNKYYESKNKQKGLLKEYISNIKHTSECVKCGEGDVACLDFHHIDGETKSYDIASTPTRGISIERLNLELKKCIVLCSNCHRKLHYYSNL